MVLTDKQISDILRDAAGEGYTPHEVARILEDEIMMKHRELLAEIAAELEVVESLVQRNFPEFDHPLLEKIREV